MVEQDNHRDGNIVSFGREDAPRTILLFHGYTGGTDDFGDLPEKLAAQLDALVLIPLLIGHGTNVKDLLPVTFEQLRAVAEESAAMCVKRGKPYAFGGYSFGSYMAMFAASASSLAALFLASTPYSMKYFLQSRLAMLLSRLRNSWPKVIKRQDEKSEGGHLYYADMPSKILLLLQQARREAPSIAREITCPLLTIHSRNDSITHATSSVTVARLTSSTSTQHIEVKENGHSFFFGGASDLVAATVIDEFARAFGVQVQREQKRVAAVIAEYNENDRIANVLRALSESDMLSEIIVVDDGSKFPLLETMKNEFPNIKFIRYEKNRGKAHAMSVGVEAATSEYIFFCDADLEELRPEHIRALIMPVTVGGYAMSIGIRDNRSQKAFLLFALNSGERCLSREDWMTLPSFYKQGFRIETGLNAHVWIHGKGLYYQHCSYWQTVRERKYGLFHGFRGRMRMGWDILVAWIYAALVDVRTR